MKDIFCQVCAKPDPLPATRFYRLSYFGEVTFQRVAREVTYMQRCEYHRPCMGDSSHMVEISEAIYLVETVLSS